MKNAHMDGLISFIIDENAYKIMIKYIISELKIKFYSLFRVTFHTLRVRTMFVPVVVHVATISTVPDRVAASVPP